MIKYDNGQLVCDCGSISFTIEGEDFSQDNQIVCSECNRRVLNDEFDKALIASWVKDFYQP